MSVDDRHRRCYRTPLIDCWRRLAPSTASDTSPRSVVVVVVYLLPASNPDLHPPALPTFKGNQQGPNLGQTVSIQNITSYQKYNPKTHQ